MKEARPETFFYMRRPTQTEPAPGLKEFCQSDEATARADAPALGIPTTPEEVAAFERYMAEISEDLAGYDCDFIDYDDSGAGRWCECDGSGWIVTCVDDICRGAGFCIHGEDGMRPCPCGAAD